MVKSLRTTLLVRGVLIALLSFQSSGCAVHLVGIVAPGDGRGTTLTTMEGKPYRLILSGDAKPMAYLDGHEAEIDGVKTFGRVRVQKWKVTQGLHGLEVWVGPLDERGVQVGIQDRNTGSYFLLDPDGAEALVPYVGETVLLEGYVVGAHVVKVVYYRVLAPKPRAQDDTGGSP